MRGTHRVHTHLVVLVGLVLLVGLLSTGCTKTPEQLVAELGDPQTLVREKAKQQLLDLDAQAIPALLGGVAVADAHGGIASVLIHIGEESYAPTAAKVVELCAAGTPDQASVNILMRVLEETGTPDQILGDYINAAQVGGCADKAMLDLILRLEPPKDDVTIDPGMNLRYSPVRFAYKKDPDLPTSRALARLCLYDPVLGKKVAEMNRDKDEAIYWNQWRMHDPLIRANLSRHLDDVIWGEYHDNFIPDILAEEWKANADDPIVSMAVLATEWRKRRYDAKAAERLTDTREGLKTYFATNDHYFDEPCLCFQALEEITKPVRGSLDESKRKREVQALDEALAALATDRETACKY